MSVERDSQVKSPEWFAKDPEPASVAGLMQRSAERVFGADLAKTAAGHVSIYKGEIETGERAVRYLFAPTTIGVAKRMGWSSEDPAFDVFSAFAYLRVIEKETVREGLTGEARPVTIYSANGDAEKVSARNMTEKYAKMKARYDAFLQENFPNQNARQRVEWLTQIWGLTTGQRTKFYKLMEKSRAELYAELEKKAKTAAE